MVNALTQEPIGRALVYSPDNRFATLTDSEGRFEFVVPGQNTPSQQADGGFFVGSPNVVFTGSSINLFLRARKRGFLEGPDQQQWIQPSPDQDITIPLTPEALIKGHVSLSSNEPAAGMEVQLFTRQVQDGIARWMPATATRTNSAGEFRLAGLRPGTYKLFTRELMDLDPVSTPPGGQLYGYPPIYYPGVDDFAAAATIHLAAGQVFQTELSPVRQPYYRVSIPVLNFEQNFGLNVVVSRHGHAGPGYSLGYNPEKHTIEGMLPSGSYLVQVADFGPNPAAGAVNITVAGAPVQGPGLVLTRNGSITVNVTEEFTSSDWQAHATWSDGKRTFALRGPRSYLNVTVEPTDDFIGLGRGSIRPPRGADDDLLVIENLPPGRYWLRVQTSRGYVAAATMAGVDLLHQPFVFVPGSTTPIEITMRDDVAEIEGTVSGLATPSSYAGPGTSAYIYCVPVPDGTGQYQQLWASADGSFHSLMMAPGTYRILAFKKPQPDLPYRDPEAMRAYETKSQVVTLAPRQKLNLQLQLVSSE